MKKFWRLFVVATAAIVPMVAANADAGGPKYRGDKHARYQAQQMPWHGEYYHTAHGYAVPLVVPPTARMHTEWGWGVAQSEVTPIYHQFRRPYYGEAEDGDSTYFRPTPPWPSSTRQFGVYYSRGPWR